MEVIVIDGKSYGLSAADLADRMAFINASEAPTICSGDPQKRHALWLEKTGQTEPEDLSDNILVQFGSYTEAFNIAWLERKTGLVVADRQRVVKADHLRCTLDGMTTYRDAPCVVEAKFMSPYAKREDRIQWYMPQVFTQMHLTGARQALLSVLDGSPGHDWILVDWDQSYADAVLAQLADFHACVAFGQPPHDAPALDAPKVSDFKPYDFSERNDWIYHAGDWTANKEAAAKFKSAEKCLKEIIPEDASEVKGGNIIAKRSKSGAITIKGVAA